MTSLADAKTATQRLLAIAEPTRLRIIETLLVNPANVTELAGVVKTEIVNVSHHLGVMKSAGLVTDKKKGRYVVYALNPDLVDLAARTFTFGPFEVKINQAKKD